MSSRALLVAVVLSPFVLLPVAGWLGGRGASRARLLAAIPGALTVYFAYAARAVLTDGPVTAALPWADRLGLSLAFHLDGLSLLFAMLISGIGTLIVLYAAQYLDGHPDAGRFHTWLFAFMGSMLGLVLSDNVILLFVFWELTGFTSYLLIGFEHDRPEARRAALQALLVTGGGGLALMAAAVMLWQAGGTASLSGLLADGASFAGHPLYVPMASLVLLAAFTKSAQFPFHFWLPNAMQAPTPVSAYLHSATMVKAGVYLVARLTPLLGGTAFWMGAITIAGTLTMLGGAYRAVLETDLKRVLAYSTISALGVLMLLLGIGTGEAIAASVVYLLAHACYKGALFLAAGAVEHETGSRDVSALAGLRRAMPRTAAAAGLAAASMAGIPLLLGFIAKEQLYEAVAHVQPFGLPAAVLVSAAIAGSALLGTAGLIAGVSPFIGRPAAPAAAHEAPASLWLGPLVLGVIGLVAGSFPALLDTLITHATTAVTRAPASVHLALWHGPTPTLALSGATLALTALLFAARARVRKAAWPRALRTERLYSGGLAILDAVSVRAAPWLQGGSLRSYVLTVVLTAIALVATALLTRRVLPTPSRWTPIALHEGLMAALVVGAAVAAARAQSSMTAVLSLGTVGYGVAVIYALFGAPDLAMTQFAVETLTVVIFVLVFRDLRGFADLSSRAVRVRDAAIAGTAGLLVTTLVLFIGASGTTSRLSDYFADAGPRLAHGRNIVNVILVDFRSLDTMGEITVLVTVAVGVRALLSIAAERRA